MKLMLFVDPPGLVGPALVNTVINLGGNCSLSFVLQIAQAVKNAVSVQQPVWL